MPPQSARITVVLDADDARLRKTILANAALAGKSVNNASTNSSFLALGRITGKANEFQKSLAASNARVIAFGASAGAIFAVRSAFQLLLTSTIQVEKQLADIDSIFKLGGSNLQKFASNLFGVANATSMAFSEAAKAATELSRQGLSVEETLKRTASALTLSRLSGLGVEESVSSLTATLNSFNREALDSETIINRLTSVDAAYAVSAGDLSKALSRVSASANDAKVSFNETVGLITAAQQITARGGSVIGNAFKSIFTRLQRPQVLEDLEAAGVAVRDLNGQVVPMIQVLRNLATTYDDLSSSQKSFVSETVGGVYQVNILKAVLRDVGSDVSVFDGAMRAAGDSSGSADRRLKALNNTISSQLVRSMNELVRAASNVGNSLVGPGLKTGLQTFEQLAGGIADSADPNTTKKGGIGAQAGAIGIQGLAQGFGNVIKGPALQFIVFTLTKLLDRLISYGVEALKDLDGINSKEKERLAINESIATYLKSQPDLLSDINSGLTSVASGSKAYLDYISQVSEKYRVISTLSSSMGELVQPKISVSQLGGVVTTGAASGYIPSDLDAKREVSIAKKAGYISGRPVKTTVQSGNSGVPIIANTAETKSSIQSGNKIYQFVNPQKGTMAAKTHQAAAIRKTGIDPFALPQQPIWATAYMPHAAKGFIPNLASRGESILQSAGIKDWRKEIGLYSPVTAGKAYPQLPEFDLDWLPDNFVAAVTEHFNDPRDIQKLVFFAQRKIYNSYLEDKKANPDDTRPKEQKMKETALRLHSTFFNNQEEAGDDKGLWGSLRNSINPKSERGSQGEEETGLAFLRKGRSTHRENLATFISSVLGGKPFDPPAEEASDPTSLLDETAEALLNKFGPTLPTVVLYPKLQQLHSPVIDQPDFKAVVKLANRSKGFNVPAPIVGHPTLLNEILPVAEKNVANIKEEFEATPGDLSTQLGAVLNRKVKNSSRRLGYPQPKENSLLDLPFDFPEFLKGTSFQGPSSGSEVKTSEEEARKGSPTKIFKSIVGNPEHKTGALTGPVEAPAHFAGVPKYVEGRKTGIVDYNHFASAKRNEMMTMMADAIARKNKALKIIHAPALASVSQGQNLAKQMAGGANYITSEADIDQYEQFIWNSSVRTEKGVESGFSGLLFSLADSVHGIPLPDELSEERLRDYTNLRNRIKDRKGSRYSGAARGSIPNLGIIPFISPFIGKIATNVVDSAEGFGGAAFSSAGEYVKQHGFRSAIKRVLQDKPLYKKSPSSSTPSFDDIDEREELGVDLLETHIGLGDIAYREMFGLKARNEPLSGLKLRSIPQRPRTYAVGGKRGTNFISEMILGSLRKVRGGKDEREELNLSGLATMSDFGDFDVSARTRRFPRNKIAQEPVVRFSDTWDFALHDDESLSIKDALAELKDRLVNKAAAQEWWKSFKTIRHATPTEAIQQVKTSFSGEAFKKLINPQQKILSHRNQDSQPYGNANDNYGSTPLTRLMRYGIDKITSPVTFVGQLSARTGRSEVFNKMVGLGDAAREASTSRFAASGSIPDAFEDMGGFMNSFKLQDTIATKAKEYVRNSPKNIQEKFKNSFAQDFFAGALTNGALGKSFAGDLGVLKETSGFSDSLFEVMLQDFMSKVNVPELTKRISLGEFAKGFVPNLAEDFGDSWTPEDAARIANAFSYSTGGRSVGLRNDDLDRPYNTHVLSDLFGHERIPHKDPETGKYELRVPHPSANFLSRLGALNITPNDNPNLPFNLAAKPEFIKYEQGEKDYYYIQRKFQALRQLVQQQTKKSALGLVPNLSLFSVGDIHDKKSGPEFQQMRLRAERFIHSNDDVYGLYTNQMDREALAVALAHGALGKSNDSVLSVLRGSQGFAKRPFESVLAEFRQNPNAAQGMIPNLNLRDPQVEGLTYVGRKKGINILRMDRTVNSFQDDARKHLTKLEEMPPAKQEAYLFKLIGGKHTESSKKIFNKLGSGDQTFLIKEMQGLLGEIYAQQLFLTGGRKITRHTEATRFDLSVDEMGPAEVRTRTRIKSFPDITDKFKGVKGHKYLITPSDTKFRAEGSVPDIRDAMSRENRMTGGQAKLGISKKLITQSNPLGYVVYDKSSQSSPEHAIQQHLASGQSMSEIKTLSSGARGVIPNLAGEEGFFGGASVFNSILLGLTNYGQHLIKGTTFLDGFTKKFGSAGAKMEIELKELAQAFDQAQNELLTTGRTSFQKQSFVEKDEGLNKLTATYNLIKASKDTPTQKAFREQTVIDRDRQRSFGNRTAIIAGIGGGFAGKVADRFSVNVGTSIQELSLGLQTAGQALSAFPGAIGKSLAIGLSAGAVASSLDIFGKGLAQARKDYEVTQSKFQQLSAQVDVIAVSLNNYDNLINDSSVSLETLVRESRKYSEGVAALGQTPEGRGALTSVIGASDNKEVVQQLMKYRDEQGRAMERQTALLSLKEYAATKTFKLPGLQPFGDPFSYANIAEKNTVDQLTRGLASQGVASLDGETKAALIKAAETPEKFNEIMRANRGDLFDFLTSITSSIGEKNVPTVTEGIRKNLLTEKAFSSPEGTVQVRELQKRNAQRQVTLDSAIRQEASARRLFVNKGSLQASNILDTRAIEQKNRFDNSSIRGAQRQADTGLYQLQYGERSVRAYETGGELAKVETERQNKSATVSSNLTRQITDSFSKNFDDLVKAGNKLGPPGTNNVAQLGPNNEALVNALNKGITSTVRGGDFSRFNDKGVLDTKRLIAEITKNAGGTSEVNRGVTEYLQGSNGIDILNMIEVASLEQVAIDREALTESKKLKVAFDGFEKQMDFKQLSSFMGGLKNLTDRGSRRSTERDTIRNIMLLRRGTTAESRGIGGAGLLELFKKQNIPIDLSGKSNQSKLMVEAFNASVKGLASVNKDSFDRIINSTQRLGIDPSGLKGQATNAKFFDNAAFASVQKEFLPENDALAAKGLGEIDQYSKLFASSLDISTSSVYYFSDVLMKSAVDITTAMLNTAKVREKVAADRKQDEKNLPVAKQQRKATAKAEQERLRDIDFGTTGTGTRAFLRQLGQGDLEDEQKRDQFINREAGYKGVNPISSAALAVPGIGVSASTIALALLSIKPAMAGLKEVGSLFKGTKNLITKGTTSPVAGQNMLTGSFPQTQSRVAAIGRAITGRLSAEELAKIHKDSVARSPQPRKDIRINLPSQNVPVSTSKQKYPGGLPFSPPNTVILPSPAPPIAIARSPAPPIALALQPHKRKGRFNQQQGLPIIPNIPAVSHEEFAQWTPQQQAAFRAGKAVPAPPIAVAPKSSKSAPPIAVAPRPYSPVGSMRPKGGAMGFAASPMMGGMGGNLASLGMQLAGSQIGGTQGTALMLGSMFAPQALAALGASKVGAAGMAAAGSLALPAAAVAAAGYGIYKGGRAYYGLDKLEGNIVQGESDLTNKYSTYVNDKLKKGGSVKSIQSYLEGQLRTNESSISSSQGYLEGGERKPLEEANTWIKNLIDNLSGVKDQADQQNKDKALESKQEEILTKQAQLLDLQIQSVKGNGQTQGLSSSTMKIEISIKDAEKIPELLMKEIISPLKQQLDILQTQTNALVNKESPQPAKV
jgi:TP901 family phage tail tape measure protein